VGVLQITRERLNGGVIAFCEGPAVVALYEQNFSVILALRERLLPYLLRLNRLVFAWQETGLVGACYLAQFWCEGSYCYR
jgi:hypothetical protein